MIRSPEDGDLHLGKWTIPKGELVLIPSYVIHRDEGSWPSSGSPSLETFWAKRFLSYPQASQSTMNNSGNISELKKEGSPEELAIFSADNLTGCFMPYGGGSGICPSRHFAKYGITSTLAIMTTKFDIELLDDGGRMIKADLAGFGFGALKPKGKTRVRIRRKALQNIQ